MSSDEINHGFKLAESANNLLSHLLGGYLSDCNKLGVELIWLCELTGFPRLSPNGEHQIYNQSHSIIKQHRGTGPGAR